MEIVTGSFTIKYEGASHFFNLVLTCHYGRCNSIIYDRSDGWLRPDLWNSWLGPFTVGNVGDVGMMMEKANVML